MAIKKNIVSIHQPNFLPYPGLFCKIAASDTFVIYDTAQYVRGEYHNRNRLIIGGTPTWATIPVSFHLGDRIRDVRISPRDLEKTWLKICQAYAKAEFSNECREFLASAFLDANESLCDFNTEIIARICRGLGLNTEIHLLSQLIPETTNRATQALIEICVTEMASEYLSGTGGRNYLEFDLFERNNIILSFQQYAPTPYPQKGQESFHPHLSILDMLFNIGIESSSDLIKSAAMFAAE